MQPAPAPIPFKVAIQSSGEATSDDYTLMTPELQFAAGESSKTIHIKIKDDSIAEPEKRIRLVLSKNSLGSGGVRSFHEIHIKDDDGANTTRKVVDFRNGAGFWCALYDDKTLKCWGSNAFYNLGTGNMVDSPSIPTTPLFSDVESFDVGDGVGVCVVTTAKDLWCWGRFLGNDVTVPTKIITGGVKKAILIGSGIIYLNDSNELWAWGTDSTTHHQLYYSRRTLKKSSLQSTVDALLKWTAPYGVGVTIKKASSNREQLPSCTLLIK